ncbi:MAG: hypothetical protein AAGF47_03870 [Planctomycetota bacterium]
MPVTSRLQVSSAIESGEIDLEQYKIATIYDSETASFFELEIETLLESVGLRIVGENEAVEIAERGKLVLGVRAREKVQANAYGHVHRSDLVILLEDVSSDRTLVTASGGAMRRDQAWRAARSKLLQAFGVEDTEPEVLPRDRARAL